MSTSDIVVTHDETNSRYLITVDGRAAGFADYEVAGADESIRDFNHTVIDPEFRGQGLSKPLIRFALEDTQETGLKVRPSCSAVEGFITANSEFAELVAP